MELHVETGNKPLENTHGANGKVSVYNAGDPGSIPGSGRSPGEGNSNPLQYYCLENPMDREAWQAMVHGVTKELDMTKHRIYLTSRSPFECGRKQQSTPVFLPGKSLGPRNLAGCSPWGRKESDTTERLHFTLYFFTLIAEEGFLISSCYSLELCIQMLISFLFSFVLRLSSFHSYLQGLLRQPFCFFAFLFHGDGLDPCLLYNVTNLIP